MLQSEEVDQICVASIPQVMSQIRRWVDNEKEVAEIAGYVFAEVERKRTQLPNVHLLNRKSLELYIRISTTKILANYLSTQHKHHEAQESGNLQRGISVARSGKNK